MEAVSLVLTFDHRWIQWQWGRLLFFQRCVKELKDLIWSELAEREFGSLM